MCRVSLSRTGCLIGFQPKIESQSGTSQIGPEPQRVQARSDSRPRRLLCNPHGFPGTSPKSNSPTRFESTDAPPALNALIGFDYTWEVCKLAAQRKYGHYVLPVLYGDRFIARVEPIFNRKARVLMIVNWWREAGVAPDDAMLAALAECAAVFERYLGAEEIRLGEAVTAGDGMLEQVVPLLR